MREFELAGLDSVRSFLKRASSRHAPPPGSICANCDTELAGLYCHTCGQAADNHHRNIWHLIWEGIEGLFHMDGRLWRTLPPLFFRPGLLARDYMAGRIARHVPPFRTFLVSLLLFIFAAEHMIHQIQHGSGHAEPGHAQTDHTPSNPADGNHADEKPSPAAISAALSEARQDRDDAIAEAEAKHKADLAKAKNPTEKTLVEQTYQASLKIINNNYDKVVKDPVAAAQTTTVNADQLFAMSPEERAKLANRIYVPDNTRITVGGFTWNTLKQDLSKAITNPNLFVMNLFAWGHRLAVLLLPIMSLILGALYFYRRQFFIFDHFLVSCNLLSFIFLTNALGFVLPEFVRGAWFGILALWTPINIFMTLRGAYGSGIFGAIVKTLILWFSSTLSFAILMVWLSWIAIRSM